MSVKIALDIHFAPPDPTGLMPMDLSINSTVDQASALSHNSAMRAWFALALLFVAACGTHVNKPEPTPAGAPAGGQAPPPEAPQVETEAPRAAAPHVARLIAKGWPLTDRIRPVTGAHAVVVSSHQLASDVGIEILKKGGNAVDAAVATALALAVVHPVAGNIGGGGFMMVRMHDGTVSALDFREVAPALARRYMFVDSAGTPIQSSVTGHLSIAVPGSVAGLYEASHKLGDLPWRDVVAPATRLAQDGYAIDKSRNRVIQLEAERLARFPASRAQFLVNGAPPAIGTNFVQPELARTLQLIADSGPQVFYTGSVAQLIVDEMKRGGGLITLEDLAAYQPKWRTPLTIIYRGDTIYTMPPPTGGGVALAEILNVMEGYKSLPSFGSPALMHLQAEAMRRAYRDRNAYLGDPDFVTMPLRHLLSKPYADELRSSIDPAHSSPGSTESPPPEGTETTHLSVVDAEGNAVALTTTLNNDFGSAVTVTGGGFVLNDEMDDFTSAPGKPNLYGLIQGDANAIAPGKRMLSAMTPTITVDRGGHLLMVLGSPGGSRITTAVYQVLTDLIDQGMSLTEAIGAPRLHHQSQPDLIYLERGGFVATSVDSLEAMGHKVSYWGYKTEVNAIGASTGGWIGIADPRRGGAASGY